MARTGGRLTRRTELDRLESVAPYDGSVHRRCDPVLADVMYSCLERDGLDAGTRRPIDESRYWTETVSVRVSSSGGPLMNRALLCLLGCAAAFAEVQGDEPTATDARGRIVEGKVVAAGQKPVEGARVLFGEHEVGMALVEGETATTDAQGRYRADLVKFPWSKGTVRALVLAPGYKAADGKIEAGTGPATADFELAAEPWIETRIRMADRSGRPVAGAVITCSVGRVIWARLKTDALGCCQIAMARYVGMRLSTEPKDARPIEARLSGTNNPASITLPVLPAIRGRVLDHQGWPVANAAVGRWLTFDSDGTGEMLPFLEFILGVTDRNGNFEIAPRLQLSFGVSRPTPNLERSLFRRPQLPQHVLSALRDESAHSHGLAASRPEEAGRASDRDAQALAAGPNPDLPGVRHVKTRDSVVLADFDPEMGVAAESRYEAGRIADPATRDRARGILTGGNLPHRGQPERRQVE